MQLLDAAVRRSVDLGKWAAGVMTRYPQILENVRTDAKIPKLLERLAPAIDAEEAALGAEGRVLIRESGTEPVVRVMVEAAEQADAEVSVQRLVDAVEQLA